jgi:hypothetical protein
MGTRTSKIAGISLLVATLLVGGCRSQPEGDELVLSTWLVRNQRVAPVVPPREDVRVGDVHLYLSDPDGSDPLSLYAMPRWSHLPSSELLRANYRDRPENPPTPTDYLRTGSTGGDREWRESIAEPESADPRAPSRLRSLQLPSFTIYKEDHKGTLPTNWGLQLALDDSYTDWRHVRIRVEAAETTGLALEDALRAYLERRSSGFYLPESLRQNLRALAPDDLETVWIRIVTEVVYMRAMQITVVSGSEFDIIDDDVSAVELGEPDDEAGSKDEDLDPTYAGIARANALNQKMIASGTDVLPDGFIRFINVSEDAISARRVYRRATAIGVAGLSLTVDPATGAVERVRLIGHGLAGAGRPEPEAPDADEPSDLEPEEPAADPAE